MYNNRMYEQVVANKPYIPCNNYHATVVTIPNCNITISQKSHIVTVKQKGNVWTEKEVISPYYTVTDNNGNVLYNDFNCGVAIEIAIKAYYNSENKEKSEQGIVDYETKNHIKYEIKQADRLQVSNGKNYSYIDFDRYITDYIYKNGADRFMVVFIINDKLVLLRLNKNAFLWYCKVFCNYEPSTNRIRRNSKMINNFPLLLEFFYQIHASGNGIDTISNSIK